MWFAQYRLLATSLKNSRKKIMQILINAPDILPQAVVLKRIKELEEILTKEAQQPRKTASKWEKMVQRIELKTFDLEDYTNAFNQNRQQFRKTFAFKDEK